MLDLFNTFQKMYLDVATNELTSHGALMFAVLSSTFVFLRIINDNFNRATNNKAISKGRIITYGIMLTVLYGLSIYVFGRLIEWARLLNEILFFDEIANNYTTFTSFVGDITRPLKERLTKTIYGFLLTRGPFPSLITISIDLSLGSICTMVSFYAIGILDTLCKKQKIILVISSVIISLILIMMSYL